MKLILIFFALMMVFIGVADTPVEDLKRIREGIEWCDTWIPSVNDSKAPKVLLVGDSITKGYYNSVSKHLEGKAVCARFATSACVSDPAFHAQLAAMFSGYSYSVIHFNNGLHGIGYTEDEYRQGYELALQYIKEKSPQAKLILVLSTPLQSGSKQDNLNSRIDARNQIVRELAKKYGAVVNDLHSISKGHPEYYRDPYHYKPDAIELQGRQVADAVLKELERT